MTLSMKLGGAWKEAQSLHVKINGEWKDVSTLYSKKDGAWVTVYSSGALITFTNYPHPIPVATGWKYSTDKVNWTTVTSDSTINDSGTFTGWVKTKGGITLNEFYTEHIEAQFGLRRDGNPMPDTSYRSKQFTLNDRSFVLDAKAYIDNSENWTQFEFDRYNYDTAGVLAVGGYGFIIDGSNMWGTSRLDYYGNLTTGYGSTSIQHVSPGTLVISKNNSPKGFILGGGNSSSNSAINDVDMFYSNGVFTTAGSDLLQSRWPTSTFTIGERGFVYGGKVVTGTTTRGSTYVEMYNYDGTMTQLDNLRPPLRDSITFSLGNYGYACGGHYYNSSSSNGRVNNIYKYDSNGNKTSGGHLSKSMSNGGAFVLNGKGYVISNDIVNIIDTSGVITNGESLSKSRYESTVFLNNNKGYVCGGNVNGSRSNIVDIYYETPDSYATKLPITSGSTYTLNGESGVANVSKVMEFNSKVSGTIDYKKGTVPSN